MVDFGSAICQYSTMNDTEMLKQNLVDKRLTLASLMFNASSSMSEDEIAVMKADCQRLHLFANNEDLEGALQETDKMIEELKRKTNNDG